MNVRDALEVASFAVTVVALPFALLVFLLEQRKERENEEEEGYQHLSDAYSAFLKIVLDNADLQLRSASVRRDLTPEQSERVLIIFDMLISLFERAYLVAYREQMSATERVLRVLKPIWITKNETASRVRSRIELVLAYAKAKTRRASAGIASGSR